MDQLMAADRDGDGRAALVVFRPGNPGSWYVLKSSSGYKGWEIVPAR